MDRQVQQDRDGCSRAFQAPVSYPSDPQPLSRGRILLADYASPGAVVILDRHGRVLWRYGPASGWGELNHPSLAIMLPNGDIAVNDDYNDRVVIIDPKRRQIVWQYGHRAPPGTRRELPPHAGRDGLRPARPAREAALAARPPPVAHEHMFA